MAWRALCVCVWSLPTIFSHSLILRLVVLCFSLAGLDDTDEYDEYGIALKLQNIREGISDLNSPKASFSSNEPSPVDRKASKKQYSVVQQQEAHSSGEYSSVRPNSSDYSAVAARMPAHIDQDDQDLEDYEKSDPLSRSVEHEHSPNTAAISIGLPMSSGYQSAHDVVASAAGASANSSDQHPILISETSSLLAPKQ